MRQPLRAEWSGSLAEVARALDINCPGQPPALSGISTDSRDVQPGDLFVALRGSRFDGHQFLASAVSAGASAVLVQTTEAELIAPVPALRVKDTLAALGQLAQWWRRRLAVRLIAVTGSNGKTTTKEMIAQVLAAHTGDPAAVLVTPGNFNNFIGLPLSLLGGQPGQSLGVVELGMNAPGEIAQLAALAEPEVGVVTNAAEAHLQRFGSVDGVARAKAELWEQLGPQACAVVPLDDPRLPSLARGFAGRTVTFGEAAQADVRVMSIMPLTEGKLGVSLSVFGHTLEATLSLLGRHNALNAAAAAAACHALGVDIETIRTGLGRTPAMPHRARLVTVGGVLVLDDCYNANPPSVRAGVATLLELPGAGRAGVVIGDLLELGEAAVTLHRDLGRDLVSQGVSLVVGVGPLAAHLCEGASAAGATRVWHVRTPEEAARAARQAFRPGDRVLLKGSRGMALETVLQRWKQELGEQQEVA